jgi:hypothetical protein
MACQKHDRSTGSKDKILEKKKEQIIKLALLRKKMRR